MIPAVVDALATYRLTRLAVTDDIFDTVREQLKDDALDPTSRVPAMVFDLLDCRWCVSVWLGLGVAAARRLVPAPWGWLAEGLAWSAVAGLLAEPGELFEATLEAPDG